MGDFRAGTRSGILTKSEDFGRLGGISCNCLVKFRNVFCKMEKCLLIIRLVSQFDQGNNLRIPFIFLRKMTLLTCSINTQVCTVILANDCKIETEKI